MCCKPPRYLYVTATNKYTKIVGLLVLELRQASVYRFEEDKNR